MTATAHNFEPEQVMALLDGELPPAEAQAVLKHLEHCTQCAALAEELTMTSQTLAGWTVPAVPAKLEAAVRTQAVQVDTQRRGPWRRKPWLLEIGGVMALVLVCVGYLAIPRSVPSSYMTSRSSASEPLTGGTDRFAGGGLAQFDRAGIAGGNPQQFEGRERAGTMSAPPPPVPMPPQSGGGGQGVSAAPMIAHTASMTIEVKQIAAARSSLDAILARHRGYWAYQIVHTPENGQADLQGSLLVPVQELAATLADLKTLGRVQNEAQSGEEVGQQHADLEARLKTARDTEERFRSILQSRTGTVSDVMQVQEGIARVRGEIEGMEAEQRGLNHRVDFVTIALTLNEEYKARLDAAGDSIGTQMGNAFVTGYRNAKGTVLGIVIFLEEYGPALLIWFAIIGIPLAFAWRRYGRMRRRL